MMKVAFLVLPFLTLPSVVVALSLWEQNLSELLEDHPFCPNIEKLEECYKFLDGVASLTDANDPKASSITSFGFSEYAHKIPMSVDAHFPIASNSKLYTTVAIYQLYEQGKLDVKADIATMLDKDDFVKFGWSHRHRKLCPRLPYSWACQKITLEHLLSMSSGIYPELNCNAMPNSILARRCNPVPYFINPGSMGLVIGTFLDQPLIFQPGAQYHYSNPNFVLAAYFVEKYSGMTFRDYLETHIFSKIGLNNTYYDFFDQDLKLDPLRVQEYFKYFDNTTEELMSVGFNKLQLDLGVASGTGGVISTVQDQVKFWHTVFNRTTHGAPLFQHKSTLAAILKPFSLTGKGSLIWKNETIPTWTYYAQGIGIICTNPQCRDSPPRWIIYEGGTVTVHTANVMDFETYDMSQLWTTSIVLMTDPKTFQATFERQKLDLDVFTGWASSELNDAMKLALVNLFRHSPPKRKATSGLRAIYG